MSLRQISLALAGARFAAGITAGEVARALFGDGPPEAPERLPDEFWARNPRWARPAPEPGAP